MTALGKLVRSTAFWLTLVYLLIFALYAAALLVYFALNTGRLITEQITETVDDVIAELTEQYTIGSWRQLTTIVENRSLRPGSSLYLVTAPSGQAIAGNVGSLAPGVIDKVGWSETVYRRLDERETAEHSALVRVTQLSGGFRLLVGRDLEERARMREVIVAAARGSVALVIVLGLAGGFFVARRVLKRFDAMTETTQRIMAGDLSGRLPVTGIGDELDRLAMNLNDMLERIEALMRGLKEVSDNIAHDLKTPLTRLRNRCEAALRSARSEAEYRDALQDMIEESDGLIRTFDALLMIARAESGHARENMTAFDAAEIVRGVAELYEPLAEEKGLALKIDAPGAAMINGNRELLSQALANLVDNAIKYARPAQAETAAQDGENTAQNGVGAARNGDAAAQMSSPEIVLAVRAEGDRVLLSVADRGPGIAEADRSRVVERFVRLDQSGLEPGSGLGLSLAAAVARLHGGALRLEDNAPGLKVVIALPRNTAA
ncbi:MAG: HAMP domain-containing protein [Alphaproteobacteria bacterium]|nr:MAG: HAMP domain-containing protein [Alphaproteobacteria bacterium]